MVLEGHRIVRPSEYVPADICWVPIKTVIMLLLLCAKPAMEDVCDFLRITFEKLRDLSMASTAL